MKKIFVILILFVSLKSAAQEELHSLVVNVENVKSAKGNIMIGLYDCQEKFLKEAIKGGDIRAEEGIVTITFEGIKSGEYAISLFHDKNENGKLDANFIGIPTEPYAFSNNAKGMFGPPDFAACRFELNDDKVVTIDL